MLIIRDKIFVEALSENLPQEPSTPPEQTAQEFATKANMELGKIKQ
jgi:NaMN:DMB phosphoribosyltransferase